VPDTPPLSAAFGSTIARGASPHTTPTHSKAANKRTRVGYPGIRRTPDLYKMVYPPLMARTNIDIDESLIRKARKLTRLKTKRQIVDKALELLVRTESRKGILRYYGTGIWEGDLKTSRRNRV